LCADARLTGGKAAELCRLLAEGLPVPQAFVLPLDAFAAHFPDPDPGAAPQRPALHPELSAELERISQTLCVAPEDQMVVRSSALSEDGACASFAGQHATYYYITQANIDKAVTDCWLSLWSEAAAAYRAGLAGSNGPFGMAVIVQRMVRAERSGVCFTEDPTSAIPGSALLESTWGLGAALVDGRVSPDRFWIGEDGAILDRKIARKRLKVGEDMAFPAEQRLEPVPLNRQVRPTLSDIEVTQIADISRQIATRRGEAQDVEWAIEGDELFILQSRPVTTIHNEQLQVEGRWVLFKPTVENFSEPFTPITVDLLRRFAPFGCFIQGRFYLNADVMNRLLPWSLDDETLSDLLLLRGPPPDEPLHWRRVLRLGAGLSIAYLCGGIGWHRTASLRMESLAAFEPRCKAVLEDDSLDPLQSLKKLILNDHPLRPMGEFPFHVNVSAVRYFLLLDLLKSLLTRIAPDFDQYRLSVICAGGSDMLSQQMVEGIRSLAEVARADDELRRGMIADEVDLQGLILKLPEPHPFTSAVQEFLLRFGHRAVRELDLMAPRWREDTTTVLAMVRNYVRREAVEADTSDPGMARLPNAVRTDTYGILLAAEDELHQSLRHRWQRSLVDYLVRRIRYYVTLRENTRHYHTMIIATARAKLKRIELALMQDGRLHCEDDIFFLEYEEVMAMVNGELSWEQAEPLIRERRLHYQQLSQRQPIETFNVTTRIPLLQPDRNVLVGSCASPGVATGRARIIRDPSIAAELEPGEILVAPYTDPAWTPLFPGAAAIVVEVGSYLSHAGTVAREYQVPCLVDVLDCTRRIRSGQELRINATEGWLEIIE
jgi:pyruvate,water dikinase